MSKEMPFKFEDVSKRIDEITFIQPKKNDIVSNQLISIPKLNGRMLDIQFPFMKMIHGGFPQKGNSLYETFLQRANAISIPLVYNEENYNFFIKLQKKMENEMDVLVPEEYKGKVEFQDIIREYDNQKKAEIYYSFRARLALKIIDLKNEDYKVETSVWKKNANSVTEIEVNTVEDVEKIIRYGSEVQFIIRLNKMYISTKNEGTKKDPKFKMGVTFKIMAVQIKDVSSNSNVDYKHKYAFNDNDDDDEVNIAGCPVINTDNLDDINETDDVDS